MNPAPAQESVRPAKPAASASPPNYASREETMKIAERVMEEDREVFRRLANA